MGVRQCRTGFEIRVTIGGKRTEIYLPKITEAKAKEVESHILRIAASNSAGLPIESAQSAWLAGIDDSLHAKLAKRGIVPERAKRAAVPTFDIASTEFVDSHPGKESTKKQFRQCFRDFSRWLAAKKKSSLTLDKITEGDAVNFDKWLRLKLADATARKRCSRVKQVFTQARRDKMIDSNPFDAVATCATANEEKWEEVPAEVIHQLLKSIECPDMRMVIALCRFGGFRFHETAINTWEGCVDMDEKMLTILSNKVPRKRKCPIFKDLMPFLAEVPKENRTGRLQKKWAEDGNPRTQLVRYIRAAELQPWADPTHMLRKNKVTDLLYDNYPPQTVSKWIGHDVRVLMKHYAIMKSSDLARAQGA